MKRSFDKDRRPSTARFDNSPTHRIFRLFYRNRRIYTKIRAKRGGTADQKRSNDIEDKSIGSPAGDCPVIGDKIPFRDAAADWSATVPVANAAPAVSNASTA
ncbi:MAG: hypothetical protein JSS81_20505 [Acidobacteria bacterium]|nr:hypothetical protein [Acidobacteriota bacterium]